MNYAFGTAVCALLLSVVMPAASQTIPKDTCSVLSAADLEAVLGKGAKAEAIGDEQCEYEVAHHPVLKDGLDIAVRRANGARELKDYTDLAMLKPVKPVPGVGDEAFASADGRAVAFRKGNTAVFVTSSGVYKQTPLRTPEAVIEAAKRIAAKIK